MDDQKRRNEQNESRQWSKEFSELLASWTQLYAGNYGKEPTEETILSYRLGLYDLHLKLLHEAFLGCLKQSVFPPTVAEIRKAYEVAAENAAKHYFEPEAVPRTTKEDREAWRKTMDDLGTKLRSESPEPMPGQRWSEYAYAIDRSKNLLPEKQWGWRPREESWRLDAEIESQITPSKSWHAPIKGPNIRP